MLAQILEVSKPADREDARLCCCALTTTTTPSKSEREKVEFYISKRCTDAGVKGLLYDSLIY